MKKSSIKLAVVNLVRLFAPAKNLRLVGVLLGVHGSFVALGDSRVVAWGLNNYGQTNVPPDLTNVVATAAGIEYSLAIRSDGTVIGWGDKLTSLRV